MTEVELIESEDVSDWDDIDDEAVDLVVFSIGNRKWSVEAQYVVEARLSPIITIVPGGPAHLHGIVETRGQIVPLFLLDGFIGVDREPPEKIAAVLIMGSRQTEFGIIIDGPPSFEMTSTDQIEPCEVQNQLDNEWIVGVTLSGAILLDGQALINDRNFTIGR